MSSFRLVAFLLIACVIVQQEARSWSEAQHIFFGITTCRLLNPSAQQVLAASTPETGESTVEQGESKPKKPKLIAHRGGVVDATRIENNIDSIQEAIARDYFMIEVDIRESKDGQLVVHHDSTFSRFYADDRSLADMTWDEIQSLRSEAGGHCPLNFERFAALCRGQIHLMVDTKGPDHSLDFFQTLERILRENDLLDSAIIIGTQQSRDYFRGKAKVGINASQLQTAVQEGADVSSLYVLFAHGKDLDQATVKFANLHKVEVIPSVNIFHYPLDSHLISASADLLRLQALGVTHFQIDSVYDQFLIQRPEAR